MTVVIDAADMDYKQLNAYIRHSVSEGTESIEVNNVCGQRYIGDALASTTHFHIKGIPGQNLGAFMRGPLIEVDGNAQDGVGNTMDDGEIRINGHAGDVLGYAMRGGRILVRGDVGYRVGIHMKAYGEHLPVIVIGGKAGAFLGEYMAGGAIVLLGLSTQYPNAPLSGCRLGTGMHGGRIFVKGEIPAPLLGQGLNIDTLNDEDRTFLTEQVHAWADAFGYKVDEILNDSFECIRPVSGRPYGNLYVGTN